MIDEKDITVGYLDILGWKRYNESKGTEEDRIRADERIKVLEWVLQLGDYHGI